MTIQKANQHERKFIEKFYDKPQYGRDQKGRQLKQDKKNLGPLFSGLKSFLLGFHDGPIDTIHP